MNGRLKQIRETRAFSQKELAETAKVDKSTIYRAERGLTKLRPSTRKKLALALGIKPDELTSRQGILGI